MINYPKLDTPLTIPMWDFSWLKCGHPGGAFAAVLTEAMLTSALRPAR